MTNRDSRHIPDLSQALAGAFGNRFSLCNVQPGLFARGNTRATQSSPSEPRSESVIAINPRNPANMIGASKKFVDRSKYSSWLSPIYTLDGGETWRESSLPVAPGWQGMTDPTVAFDTFGHAFLIGEPDLYDTTKLETDHYVDVVGLGMQAYRSSDGGKTWEQPKELHAENSDDKQCVVCDNHPMSPHYGNVYVAWAASSPLRFARSTDHGETWRGQGSQASGTSLVGYAFAPSLSVSEDGTLHIVWHMPGGGTIQYMRSTDGGETFSNPRVIVKDVQSLTGHLPVRGGKEDQWPYFEHGRFRVLTIATSCAAVDGALIAAWADMSEGWSRIYYARLTDSELTSVGDPGGPDIPRGTPLLPQVSYGDTHCFHPQLAVTGTGVIGCAFYTFGSKAGGQYLIDVQLAGSWDDGRSFPWFITVTDRSWDPLIDAPWSHGDPEVDFIGDYFGLGADEEDFAVLWTDTRFNAQELFSDVVRTKRVICPRIPDLVGTILAGITQDGGGLIIVGGKIVRVPPGSPVMEVLRELAALESPTEWDAADRTGELSQALRRVADRTGEQGL